MSTYALELAKEIMNTKKTESTEHMPIPSEDTLFDEYDDGFIEIIAAKHTKAMHITLFKPLAETGSNPIIYVDDEGDCYRHHGESGSFIMYAERLLNKELTIGHYEHNQQKQAEIDTLIEA